MRAALSIALVNEALYSLYSDSAAPIQQFFQESAHRRAEFRIGSSAGFEYAAVTSKVVKSIVHEKERLERDRLEQRELNQMQSAALGYGFGGGGGVNQRKFSRSELQKKIVPRPSSRQMFKENSLSDELGGMMDGARTDKEKAMPDRARPREEKAAVRWLSPVVTDAAGKAVVPISLPESTTRWRLTSRGCTTETLVGQNTASLITRKD